jgi:hypothetical protein
MANENEDLQRQMDELRQSMQGLDESTKDVSKGFDAFGKATSDGAKQLAQGMGAFALNVGKGDTSFKSLNSVVDIASNALSGMAKAIPYAGEALAAGIKATAEASKFMLDQLDQTTKAFNDLSKSGALTADGMSGVQRQFQASGLTLQQFTKQVSANSQALARFRGMTGEGAEDFSKIVGELTKGTDDSMRRLGMTAEDIGESTGAFLTQQTRLGRAQNMTNEDLVAGTKKYAMELDALQKVTGLSREAIQKQQDAALSESRFRASIHSLNDQQQKDLLNLQTVMSSFGQELGQGTRDLVSGVANTDAAKKLMADTAGEAASIIDRLKSGEISGSQAQKALQESIKKNAEAQEGIQKYVDGPYSNFANKADLMAAKFDETGNLVKKTQKAQTDGSDDLTNKTVDAQKALQKMNIGMNELGFKFLPQAATATKALTDSMNTFVDYVNKTLGKDTKSEEERKQEARRSAGAGGENTAGAVVGGAGGEGDSGAIIDAQAAGAKSTATASASKGSYLDKMIAAESGGKNIANQSGAGGKATSSAFGVAQITKGTFEGLVKNAGPNNPLAGKTFDDMKGDVSLQMEAAKQLTDANRQALAKAGVSTSDAALYLAHFLGPGGAIKALSAPDNAPLNSAVSQAQIDANPMLQKMTSVSDLKSWSDKKMGGSGYAARGAVLSGPKSGYEPNLTMHGTEAIIPMNQTPSEGAAMLGQNSEIMQLQLNKLDELVSVMKNQLNVSTRIMQYQS